jgi:hypothetical protein
MQNAKDVSVENEFFKCYVVGDPGTGKSVFGSTFPTPAYVFNFDNKIAAYRGKDFDYETFSLDPKGWVLFEKELMEVRKQVVAGHYKTVILDSSTSMTDLAMERALQLDPKRSATGGPLWNVHYQMVKNLMEGRLRQILGMQCNVVMMGHLEIKMNQETGAIIAVEPLLTGQLSTKIPGYFDEFYHTRVRLKEGKSVFELQTVAKGFFKARSGLRGIENFLDDYVPNDYNAIMAMLHKNMAAK